MNLALIHTRGLSGVKAPPVHVEVHVANGLPSLTIVGLAEIEVREAKDRVRAAILNSGFEFPAKKIIINLAPADLPKESGRFDLPIAIGILVATGQIPHEEIHKYEWAGELSLSGDLRPIRGSLAMSFSMIENNKDKQKAFVLPTINAQEACLVKGINVIAVDNLKMACQIITKEITLPFYTHEKIANNINLNLNYPNLKEVKGQYLAKRSLEIAAAGFHSLLMIGSPGTGKSMLATRLPYILPLMTDIEALESAAVNSLLGSFNIKDWKKRPFRSPHHTASAAAMVGGSSNPRPGEISLAHHGILFLDELPEFDRKVLEVLREPLETGCITISRAGRQADFPAKFQLIAAMNPCPCGYLGHATKACKCSQEQINRYQNRLSGPLLDRIDLQVEVPALSHDDLLDNKQSNISEAECSSVVAIRVNKARDIQLQRQNKPNSALSGSEIDKFCHTNEAGINILKQAMQKMGLSARACHRALKVARTIADIENSESILPQHIAEAIQYRRALKNA